MKDSAMTRFDTRMPLEQKELFEYAATLGGFRTLTEFVLYSAKLQADRIIEKHNSVLASKKDQEVFFNAIMNPPPPNNSLKKAAKRYNESSVKK
jgi:uncharacterized protein (DUF1778 family)